MSLSTWSILRERSEIPWTVLSAWLAVNSEADAKICGQKRHFVVFSGVWPTKITSRRVWHHCKAPSQGTGALQLGYNSPCPLPPAPCQTPGHPSFKMSVSFLVFLFTILQKWLDPSVCNLFSPQCSLLRWQRLYSFSSGNKQLTCWRGLWNPFWTNQVLVNFSQRHLTEHQARSVVHRCSGKFRNDFIWHFLLLTLVICLPFSVLHFNAHATRKTQGEGMSLIFGCHLQFCMGCFRIISEKKSFLKLKIKGICSWHFLFPLLRDGRWLKGLRTSKAFCGMLGVWEVYRSDAFVLEKLKRWSDGTRGDRKFSAFPQSSSSRPTWCLRIRDVLRAGLKRYTAQLILNLDSFLFSLLFYSLSLGVQLPQSSVVIQIASISICFCQGPPVNLLCLAGDLHCSFGAFLLN